jgi:hypothetical protein
MTKDMLLGIFIGISVTLIGVLALGMYITGGHGL